jgi:poly-D-alanine transfer protein DltD
MAHNFASNSSQESRYITAQFKSHQTKRSLGDKINSLVDILKTSVSDKYKNAQALSTQLKAKRLTREFKASEINKQIEELNKQEPKEKIYGNGEEAAGAQGQRSDSVSLENNPGADASSQNPAPASSDPHAAASSSGDFGANIDK